MPVKVVKRGSKWRIVERTGRVAKTGSGKPRDGGGHRTKEMARRQQRAINRRS